MRAIVRAGLGLSLSVFVTFFLTFSTNENIVFAEVEAGVNVGQKASPFKLLTID